MITCPKCRHQEPEGALFCSDCGNPLSNGQGLQTQHMPEEPAAPQAQPGKPKTAPFPEGSAKVTLHLLKANKQLPLDGQDEFTIGRVSSGQSIVPDIDLGPYNAYQEGVSRIHALFKVSPDQIGLIDLNSINGTFVNDARIQANSFTQLKNGDVVTLGKLKIQILVRSS